MNTEELSAVVTALHGLALEQAGKVDALVSITEALIATVGLAFPPLLPELEQHLNHLYGMRRVLLDGETQTAYEAHALQTLSNIRTLQGQ